MSEPKRYKFRIRACDCVRREHLEGKYAPSALIIEETKENCGWVSYEDYALLKAEVDAWKEMVADSGVACNERARENQDLENQIERLKAEVERLTKERDKALTDFWYIHEGYFRLQAEVNRLTAFTTRTIIPNEELQAQVERLTKAGDAMAIRLIRCEERFNGIESAEAQMWYIAKEGGCP